MSEWQRSLEARAAAVAATAVAAACGTIQPQAPEGTVTIVRVERAAWNAEPEPGLFRVSFDERRARQVLARAGYAQAPEGVDVSFSERQGIEEEAGRELREKGLCATSAQLIAPVERAAAGGITALFKCRTVIF
jgi:hypothetical protein